MLAIHEELIAEHGGASGLRDAALLDAALGRPLNVLRYNPEGGMAAVAAAYALGLVKNHPFVDGNKRVSLVVAELFLDVNGYSLDADDMDCLRTWMDMAAGRMSDDEFTSWLQKHIVEVPSH